MARLEELFTPLCPACPGCPTRILVLALLALHLPAVSSTARELELGSLGTRRRVVGREVITIVGCFSRETGEAEAEVVEVEVEEEEEEVRRGRR